MSSQQRIKLFQLGGYAVGKTSIAERFFNNEFQQNYLTTVGIINYVKTLKIDDFIITIKMQDTAGQERYNAIAKNSVKETDGLIFTFDMTSKESFEMISNLLINTNDVVNLADKPLILMGNKIDKANSIVITQKDVDDLINKFKNYKISFFKTSANTKAAKSVMHQLRTSFHAGRFFFSLAFDCDTVVFCASSLLSSTFSSIIRSSIFSLILSALLAQTTS